MKKLAIVLLMVFVANAAHADVTGSLVSTTYQYTPGETADVFFDLYNGSGDAEWLTYCQVSFPLGVTVNSTTDFIGPNGTLFSDHSTGNGALVSWSDMDGGYGEIFGGETVQATFNLHFDSGLSGPVNVAWYVEGDIWGSEPHVLSGESQIAQAPVEVVPVPSSIAIGTLGIGLVNWLRRGSRAMA